MGKKLVRVTQKNIKLARKMQRDGGNLVTYNCRCPVALTVADHIGVPLGEVLVNSDSIRIFTDDGRKATLPSPKSVRKFIRAFDAKKPVKPFKFLLEFPAVCLSLMCFLTSLTPMMWA